MKKIYAGTGTVLSQCKKIKPMIDEKYGKSASEFFSQVMKPFITLSSNLIFN